MAKRRKRGGGSVHLRKDGRWEGRVVVGYDDKGLPITKNVLAKTKTACLDKLKLLKESCGEKPSSISSGPNRSSTTKTAFTGILSLHWVRSCWWN